METKELVIGVHGSESASGGDYNVLGSFSCGLLKAFNKIGVRAFPTLECFKKNILPNLTIGFNVSAYPNWPKILKSTPNIMWTVDSIFAKNFEVMQEFYNNPNFILFSVTPNDEQPISEYFPKLKRSYLFHATDLELWKKQDVKKDYDIVLFSSIEDYENKIELLKLQTPEPVFKLMMEIYNTCLENPSLPFWDIYQIYKKQLNLNLDAFQYVFLFRNISDIAMHAKKVQLVKQLSGFNLKIFGHGPWEKYISGNIEYLGPCDVTESINIMNRAKIALHPHATSLTNCIHERILNASAVETFVISSDAVGIKTAFGDSISYYDNSTFIDLAEKINYYLQNEDERTYKARNARDIVVKEHTWEARARQIISMIDTPTEDGIEEKKTISADVN